MKSKVKLVMGTLVLAGSYALAMLLPSEAWTCGMLGMAAYYAVVS